MSTRREFLAGGIGLSLHAPSAIRYATLGRTGLTPSRLLFGTATLEEPSVILRALDMGINYVDTARDYGDGNGERMVGAALKGRRAEVILSSKTIDINVPGQRAAPRETAGGALHQLDISLRELRTGYLDLWYLHHKDQAEWITDELLEAGRRAKAAGKIRFLGVSTHRVPATVDRILSAGIVDVVMATYNFTMDATVPAAIERLHTAGLGVIAFKCGAGGPHGAVRRMKRPGAIVAAYRWALRNPHVDAVESNIESVDQLEENLECMGTPFTLQDERVLAARLEQIGPYQCRMCGACEGQCRKGLPVDDILRSLMYAEGYGQFSIGCSAYRKMPEELRITSCRDCAECTVLCRYGVRVASELARAQELFG